VSTFVGTFLPASVGGDAVRAYSLSRHHVPAAPAVASVVMDRALGVVSILLLGLFSLAALHAEVPKGVYVVLVLGGVVSLGAAIVIFSDRIADVAIRASAGRACSTRSGHTAIITAFSRRCWSLRSPCRSFASCRPGASGAHSTSTRLSLCTSSRFR
jgi:uncharacterized protein (TIRG00374 family)